MTKLNFSNGNKKNVMPLLMNYTPSTKIEECNAFMQLTYDDLKQIIPLDMRIVGTKSLKTSCKPNPKPTKIPKEPVKIPEILLNTNLEAIIMAMT